jgi:3-oxoacyl-[acyl-carrier-protein] synthase-3
MQAVITAIEYHLPSAVLSNDQLSQEYPEWSVDKIESKTGIISRAISAVDECASDLGVVAAQKLFATGVCSLEEIDYLLFCTQSPDYFLPTTACIIQDQLGIPTSAGALDFNLGCSGFVYGLGLAKGLIETGQASNVLLVTADTYSKFIHPSDKSVRTLFGDAAAATLIQGLTLDSESYHNTPVIGPFVNGTDGSGAQNLIVPVGGMRRKADANSSIDETDEQGSRRSPENLFMNGSEIFTFTLRTIPSCVEQLLEKSSHSLEDIDLFVFHQANKYMLEHLRKKLKISEEKFFISMSHCGNTVSSTIPIALYHAREAGVLKHDMKVMLVGFGVGYSWGGTLIRWYDPEN